MARRSKEIVATLYLFDEAAQHVFPLEPPVSMRVYNKPVWLGKTVRGGGVALRLLLLQLTGQQKQRVGQIERHLPA